MSQKYCKYCNVQIEYDERPHYGWYYKNTFGFHFYCVMSKEDKRHRPLTNLEYLEQKYAEQQCL